MSDLTPFDEYPLDAFDQITSRVRMLTPLTALFEQAEEELKATHPEGFTPEDIGRLAWELLPEQERDQAFAELLYTYWEAFEADRETWARHEAGGQR
ncbi:hypothetical protein ACL02U_11800 [Streptomyces sp. MS06]|uniref:hypothetical protein n=1 Tax=Streptomyces sp. MS06 TaxID=3385974 RepID=UPI0039A15117